MDVLQFRFDLRLRVNILIARGTFGSSAPRFSSAMTVGPGLQGHFTSGAMQLHLANDIPTVSIAVPFSDYLISS